MNRNRTESPLVIFHVRPMALYSKTILLMNPTVTTVAFNFVFYHI